MIDTGIGRVLVASLHQAIADLMPTRLEFYESWLHTRGLRDGRIGLAQLAAVLSFLRLEGDAYNLIVARAGEYTAEWTVGELGGSQRLLLRTLPRALRLRLALRVGRRMIRTAYRGSRAVMHMRRGEVVVDIRGSIFCEVRKPASQALCEFHAAALRRFLSLIGIDVDVEIVQCRATGGEGCLMTLRPRPGPAAA